MSIANVRVLVVGAGAAAGGSGYSAGGGGGEVVEDTSFAISEDDYTVTIGDGGETSLPSAGEDGESSFFDTIEALGGKGGSKEGNRIGGDSGSGYDGGTPPTGGNYSGGGAGDSENGENGSNDNSPNAQGGEGTASDISGSTTYYGGGGNGGSNVNTTPAALGGGGPYNTPGTPNTGGGGGSGSQGHGGSGVVIVRYLTSAFAGYDVTGGSKTTDGSYTVHTFNSSGTFSVVSASTPPTVTTQAVSDIDAESAVGNGNVTEDEGETIVERGFVYDTSSHSDPGNVSPAASDYPDSVDESGSFGEGAFDLTISSLDQDTTYYVRAYAKNTSGDYGYGSEVEFTTLDYKIEGVVTLSGSPVEGATVRCIRESDNTTLTEQTTDGSGEYSFGALDIEETYHLAVEYEDGESTKYNAPSLWDITPVVL